VKEPRAKKANYYNGILEKNQVKLRLSKTFTIAAYSKVAQQLLDAGRRSKNGRAPHGLMDALIIDLDDMVLRM